jgi:PhnB protein
MMQIYVKRSIEAAEFYQKAFDAEILCKHMNEDRTAVMHAELDVYGQILALSELSDSDAITGNTMQFCLHFGEGKEDIVRKIYDVLKDGATIHYPLSPCDWSPLMVGLYDKYGVNWCIFV